MFPDEALKSRLATLSGRIDSLSEWTHKALVFGEFVHRTTPEDASTSFANILATSFCLRSTDHSVLAQSAFLSILHQHWGTLHRTHTREAAAAQSDLLTTVFLVDLPLPQEEADDLEIPDYGQGRPLTLGERKSLATVPDRRTIELAMRDPDASVASRVLGNPTLTESDVIRISAKRPQSATVLAEVATHVKWRLRKRVAMALVNNPSLPVPLGLSLLVCLDTQDARNVAVDNRLVEPLREGARALLHTMQFREQLSS